MQANLSHALVGGSCILITWLLSHISQELWRLYSESNLAAEAEYVWFFKLLLNLVGYTVILLPCFIVYRYLKNAKYFDNASNHGCMFKLLTVCFDEPAGRIPETVKHLTETTTDTWEMALCFFGLMIAYVVWGLFQEKIMTQYYEMPDKSLARFADTQFLVFFNRLLSFGVALICLTWNRRLSISVPLFKFCYCSLTNVVSTWCQYEALNYVNFPTQVLSKSCKVIPVMLMGKLVSRNKYDFHEYLTAVLISLGMVLFLFGTHESYEDMTVATVSGIALLILYMMCDSFTSSWQNALFSKYNCDSLQMLCGVNLFSCLLTGASLCHNPSRTLVLEFLKIPRFVEDVFWLSMSSAIGQLLIYRTISKFGAVVFTIIMTVRQAVSILLSCIMYGHYISAMGVFGVFIVFGAVFIRVYCRHRLRQLNRPAAM